MLVLTDLYGATPSNLAAKVARLGTPVRRVSALSLPMLLRVMNYAELDTGRTARRRRRRRAQWRDRRRSLRTLSTEWNGCMQRDLDGGTLA